MSEKKSLADTIGKEKLDEVLEFMGYLYSRWQDEKEYENFNDYVQALEKKIDCNMIRFTKNPFQAFFEIDGSNHWIKVTSTRISWRTI